jgi:hypothetical protein
MTAAALRNVLEATGYLENGQPAPGVCLDSGGRTSRRLGGFVPDAFWRSPSALTVYFKHLDEPPLAGQVAEWRREIWNEGFAPLLWVVSPRRIDLYNGFGRPMKEGDAERHRLCTFEAIERDLRELDALAGRLAMVTGQFWQQPQARVIDRETGVDRQLLSDLAALEQDLVQARLDRDAAQALIGRTIFTRYLVDRKILGEAWMLQHTGTRTLPEVLRDPVATAALFGRLRAVFNGDMFPASAPVEEIERRHLSRVADFLEAVDPKTGQTSLFPYRFDIIPVELISSIYQQFVHSKARDPHKGTDSDGDAPVPSEKKRNSVHYTRLPVVSLILDEVMDGLTGNETVLDLTCGSGVFLVEALRRLVEIKAKTNGGVVTREMIRATLYRQIHGVDISDAAIRVAVFSLYLAALELDPDPQPPELLKFEPLIGRTLLAGDAWNIEETPEGAPLCTRKGEARRFDVIVGNPPWNFKGKNGTAERRKRHARDIPIPPRGESLDFARRTMDFGHEGTRYGLVLSAMPFFARSQTGVAAAQHLIRKLLPVTLVNLAYLRNWLFPSAKMPAVALLARCRPQRDGCMTVVNVHWSPSGEKSHTFEIAPSDIVSLPLGTWEKTPDLLKGVAFGLKRDRLLLDDLRFRYGDLSSWLASIGTQLCVGMTIGNSGQGSHETRHLREENLGVLRPHNLIPFQAFGSLEPFQAEKVERSRSHNIYRAPLLLVKEMLAERYQRPIAAVEERSLIYTNSIFGTTLGKENSDSGRILAAIMNSAFASWFILMTGSEFGLWKRRALAADFGTLRIPDPNEALNKEAGRKLLALEQEFRSRNREMEPDDWNRLDQTVFDLYELDEADRIVVSDGLTRAGWQWREGLERSASPATFVDDLRPYAQAFSAIIDGWLRAMGKRRIRAEVFDLPETSPLRVIRFVIEDRPGNPVIERLDPQGTLADVLARIGERLGVRLGTSLVGKRELRVHGADEIVIIKPAAKRFWMRILALEEADAVVAESFRGTAA